MESHSKEHVSQLPCSVRTFLLVPGKGQTNGVETGIEKAVILEPFKTMSRELREKEQSRIRETLGWPSGPGMTNISAIFRSRCVRGKKLVEC
jgi:hypothetical protein